jgi:hypothetical protein
LISIHDHGQVQQDLAAVIDRVEPSRAIAADNPARSPVRSANSRRRQRPSEPEQAIIIPDQFQPIGP